MTHLPPGNDLLVLVISVAIASALLWAVPSLWVRRTRWKEPVRTTVVSVFHGPLLATVLAAGAYELDVLFWNANPGALSSLLTPSTIALLVELVVIWTFVETADLAVRRHVLSDQAESGRLLLYGIYAAGLFGVVLALLSSPEVPRLAGASWAILGFGVGILVTYLTVYIVNVFLERYFGALAHHRPRLETIYRFVRRAILAIIVVLGVAIATYANFPVAAGVITTLLLAAGFLAIIAGIAAQSTLADVIAGAMVSISQPIQIGDAISFNGEWCVVEDIRLSFTVLRTIDWRRLMVPNSLIQSSVITNYTAVDPAILVTVEMQITYESDVDKAREIMVEEARRHPDFLPYPNYPKTWVMDYLDNGVLLRLRSKVKDWLTAYQVQKDLLYSIRKRFTESGIQIPYPTRRVIIDPTSAPAPTGKSSSSPPPAKAEPPSGTG